MPAYRSDSLCRPVVCCYESPFTPCLTHTGEVCLKFRNVSFQRGMEAKKGSVRHWEVWEGGKLPCKSRYEKYKNNFKVAKPESNSQHLPWCQDSKKRHCIIWMQQSNKNRAWFCASKVLTQIRSIWYWAEFTIWNTFPLIWVAPRKTFMNIFQYILCNAFVLFHSEYCIFGWDNKR